MPKQVDVMAFTAESKLHLRVLETPVFISKAIDPSKIKGQITPEKIGVKRYLAVWDTGATNSVVSRKVINECGLQPIGVAKVNTCSGEDITNLFLINIILPNNVGISGVRATEGIMAGDSEVLIGMDIIGRGDFAVTNFRKKTAFTFRMPSIEKVDFTVSPDQRKVVQVKKVGRNDPCPCGSGKKYKNCHGS